MAPSSTTYQTNSPTVETSTLFVNQVTKFSVTSVVMSPFWRSGGICEFMAPPASYLKLGCGDLLRRLPPQVVRKIIGYLDPHTLASALQVSKFWNEMFSSEWIWKRLCYLPRWRLSPKENRNQISRVLLQHGRLEVCSGRYGHQSY